MKMKRIIDENLQSIQIDSNDIFLVDFNWFVKTTPTL